MKSLKSVNNPSLRRGGGGDMTNKLKITRIIAIIAFVTYLITMILPYVSYVGDGTYYAMDYGYKSGYVLFFIFFIPVLLFILLKHNLAMKILSIITGTLLFGLSILIMYAAFPTDYSKPNIGFFLFLLAGLLMFVASIIKFTIEVPGKKDKQHELLDDF